MAVAGYVTFFEATKGDIFKNYDSIRDIPAPAPEDG